LLPLFRLIVSLAVRAAPDVKPDRLFCCVAGSST